MAKQSGLGDHLLVAGVDLSGDIGSLGNIGGGPTAQGVTGIDQSAHARVGGIIDGRFEYSAWFNPDPLRAHDFLSVLPTGSQLLTYCRGYGVGVPGAGMLGKQLNYDGKRGNDGQFPLEVSTQIADGFPVEWGEQATNGIKTDAAPANGASIDGGAASAFGLSAYLHVTAFTGTSATVTVQDSADNSTFASLAPFAAASAVGAQRVATAAGATVRRYLRVATTGTFSSVSFHVLLVRREAA